MKPFARRLLRFTQWPMAARLLATFGLIALLPLILVGGYGYTVARQTVLEAQVRALTGRATSLASHLDLLLAERQRNIRQLAEDQEVRTFSAGWPDVSPELRAVAQEHLSSPAQTNPHFQAVYLMNRQGEVILSSTDNVGLNFGFRPYFQEAMAGNAFISDISISTEIGRPTIHFSAPVWDEAGQVVAVAVLRVLAEEIWTRVEAEKDALGPGSLAILFDEYGLRLAHASDRGLIFKAVVPLDPQVEAQLLAGRRLGTMEKIEATDFPELAQGIRQAESQPYFTHSLAIRDELFHAVAARMTSKPWTVIETLPESSFLAPVDRLVRTTGLAAGAVALLAVLVTALATRWIVRPVRALTESAGRLAAGELDRPVAGFHMQREDEVGVLLRSFETMRVSLQDSYAELDARNRRLRRLYELAVALSGDVTEVADHVVAIIAELLDVKVATVEEIHQDRIVVLSMYDHGQIVNEGEFPLRGTPCQNVREEKDVCHYTQAVEEFPDDPFLSQHSLNTYLGVPILDSQGAVLGAVNAMDDRHREFDEEDTHLLQTLAHRISVEIERLRAEEAIRRLNEELEQRVIQRTAELEAANKELEAFSYSVSHDLRAPLRGIDGFSRILLEEHAPHLVPTAARYLQLVRDNTLQMGHLIDDLLAFSRLSRQELKVQTVEPTKIVGQVLEELRTEQEGRRTEITIGELPACQADPALLKQVFANLLSNALKFTRKREVAVIEVGCVSISDFRSQIADLVSHPFKSEISNLQSAIYFVRDNGVGFDMQYAHKLFGPFQRLHRAEEYEGTGVGLAIVRRIIRRHGGRVWAEAEVDKGATFYFTI